MVCGRDENVLPQVFSLIIPEEWQVTYLEEYVWELWEIVTLTYVIVRGSRCLILITIVRHWMSYCMPRRRHLDGQFICKLSSNALSIIRSSRSTPQVNVAYLCALTSWIPEENWGEVPSIILATICNLPAKSLCAYTSRRRCFAILR